MIVARFFIIYSINIRNIGGHSLKRSLILSAIMLQLGTLCFQ
ncbi:hypothetical protein HPHPH10_0899 [Helicobacter pylori Hp H-10]|nr:hypothetical protein HPHPH10_0899 [Helicobacter pylori Hp H-10]